MTQEVPLETAIEILKESDQAIIATINAEPVPTLGDVDPEDKQVEIGTDMYKVDNMDSD